jgi:hypothetical protein
MHFEVHEDDQGAVYVHHDPYVPPVQGQAHCCDKATSSYISPIRLNRAVAPSPVQF